MNSKKSVLIVAAHPDDEILGCGATIAQHVANGDSVHIMIMAEGLTSRDVNRNVQNHKAELTELHQKSIAAGKFLGADSISIYDFPDNRMDSVELLDVVKRIESQIAQVKPEIVYTHHSGDVNIDHIVTHNAVVTACRSLPGQCVKRILFFEILSSTEWQIQTSDKTFMPNWFVNADVYMDKKLQALRFYDSEMRAYPHSRSYKSVEILAMYRGTIVGCQYAEAFMLGRNIE